MKIYESAVRKPVSTVLMFVGVMVFGLFSLMNLAVDQYPEIEIPRYRSSPSIPVPTLRISRPTSPVSWRITSIR